MGSSLFLSTNMVRFVIPILLIASVFSFFFWSLEDKPAPSSHELDNCLSWCRMLYDPYTRPSDYYNCVADCKRKHDSRGL